MVVLDSDAALGDAASCRWSVAVGGGTRELVVAETAVGTVAGDPFAALRAAELAPLPVGETPFSVLVESRSLAGSSAWYAGCAEVGGVTLLWADQDGFQSAVVLDVPGLAPAQLFDRLRVLSSQLAGSM